MKSLFLNILLSLFLLHPAHAKWATTKDAPTKNSYTQEIKINSDGTYEAIKEFKETIRTEIGRNQNSSFTLYYNGDSEKVEIIEAKTIYKGKEYKLDKQLIEDKPLASASEGFDQTRQILLAYPNIEIGATLYLKYKFILKKPPLDNFFARDFYFGYQELEKDSSINIQSELPLHILINDPENSLKITKSKDSLNLKIELKKPLYKNITSEPITSIIDNKSLTWVSVSSINKWETLAAKHGKLVAKILKQKLPKDFVKILNKAKQKKNTIEQINTVTSMLNDKIRYMGDWRSVSGRLIPRDLEKISKTQLGDCKDFSAATIAILNKLGLQAQFAIVRRGIRNLSVDILPSFTAFNHAMVKVTDKNKKVYWIDPTNFSSMAGGLYPDIANKKVLVLDPKNPSYEKIPPVNYKSAQFHLTRELEILPNNKIIVKGKSLLKNELAQWLTGATLKVSTNRIKDIIFNNLTGKNLEEKNKKGMKLPKLNSRIVKDIPITYSFIRENDLLQTNVGTALKLTYPKEIINFYNTSEDYVAIALINNQPTTYTRETTIKNIRAKNIESLNKEINTPWLYAKRQCELDRNHNLKITDTFIFYKNLLPKIDYQKPEFIKLKNWLKRNFKDIVIVFDKG